jgi:hypothetical protein
MAIWRQKVKANQKFQPQSCLKNDLSYNLGEVLVGAKWVEIFKMIQRFS